MGTMFRRWTVAGLVALTGWGSEADRQRAQDAGFDHHLTKPVDFQLLETLLRSLATPAAAASGDPPQPMATRT